MAEAVEAEQAKLLAEKTRKYLHEELPQNQTPRITSNPDVWLQECVAILSETSIEMVSMMAKKPQDIAPFLRVFALVTTLAADSKKLLQQGGGKPPPIAPGGGAGENGDMEARIAKLETAMEYVQRDLGEIKSDIRQIKDHARTDFRMLFGALIAVALGLAGLMAKGFHWL
jgi:hypothetical protein